MPNTSEHEHDWSSRGWPCARAQGSDAARFAAAIVLVALLMLGCEDRRVSSTKDATEQAPPPATAPQTQTPTPTPPAPTPDPKPDMPTNQYTGTLRGGLMAIGGETTGWALTKCAEIEGGSIVLEAAALARDLEALDGKRVTVTGEIVERQLVERGKIKRLVVKSIRAAGS